MSGFLAVFHPGATVAESELEPVSGHMAHRGPDGISRWTEGPVGLGHCLLATGSEVPGESQPFRDRNSGLVISCDARIDNRQELLSLLDLTGCGEMPDCQLILLAYARFGDRSVEYLLGDFAFVIWDPRQRSLFCARDPLGVKPFYYHLDNGLFVAASEAAAVAAHARVPAEPSEQRIADFLIPHLEGADRISTFYRHVRRLPPASCLRVPAGDSRSWIYWEPVVAELKLAGDADYIEAFSELLRDAIRVRIPAGGVVASTLSGGLDSSLVTAQALALQQGGEAELAIIAALSDRPDNCPESRSINSVLSYLGVDAGTVTPGEDAGLLESWLRFRDQIPEPFDCSMNMISKLYLLAASRGHRVVLDGVEGDLVHSLRRSYVGHLLLGGAPFRAWQELQALRLRQFDFDTPLWQVAREIMYPVLIPRVLRRGGRQLFRAVWLRRQLGDSVINPDFASRMGLEQRLQDFSRRRSRKTVDPILADHMRSVTHPLLTAGLERYDRVAARCGVEARHPLLDRRLVEFSLALPWDLKVRHGYSKYLMRLLGEQCLPSPIAWRQSWHHLGWDFTEALLRRSRAAVQREFCGDVQNLEGYVIPEVLEKLSADGRDGGSRVDAQTTWRLYALSNWLTRQSPR